MNIIRAWQRSDIDAMAQIECEAQPQGWRHAQFVDSFTHQHRGAVLTPKQDSSVEATEPAPVYGFLLMSAVLDEVQLLNIAVQPALQGQGYGQQLLAWLHQEARRLSSTARVFLEVRQSSRTAIAFYEQNGYERVGVRERYYPAPTVHDPAAREAGLIYSLALA